MKERKKQGNNRRKHERKKERKKERTEETNPEKRIYTKDKKETMNEIKKQRKK